MDKFFALVCFASMLVYIVTAFAKPFILGKKLKEYQNGLKTTLADREELVQRIKNLKCSLINQVYYNQNGDVEIVGKAGKHRFLFENGVVKSAGINTFSDKKKYRIAVEEMAIFDFLAKEENPDLPINPYNRYKNGKNFGLVYTLAPIVMVLSMIAFAIITIMPKSETYIELVKTATPENYPNTTYEEAFENFFAEPEWSHFSSERGEVVQFNGDFYYLDGRAEACFQYVIDLESSSFSLEYFGIDDVSQNMLTAGIVLETVFSSYDNYGEEIVQNENMEKVENQSSSNVVTIPAGMFYDTEVIDYMDMAGKYIGIIGTEVSLSMYSSIEDMYVGSIQIQTSEGNYSGEVVQLDTNIYQVETTDGTVIVFGVSRIVAGDVQLDLYINGEQIDYVTMAEPYIS